MKMAKLACACKPFFRTRWLGGVPYQCRVTSIKAHAPARVPRMSTT
ncbi:BZ3500_MvSof-1268-A1-R1_Chr3-1g05639 [Microbotryum saponariae]|uniref:BZ3500_MvSof-1268-A1-R1_Chr3-1g05639 protein n=1 Tax=Microbotryum saponariae TaxID=289078 RepID=A0A2X0LG58_9BASI|nr:BZ3500_MvSof-1268-A1-R1_Chr3-1g05639 [Microbotryum saponariae]SDA04829.1 BZ3501_MvSof-1269-A2-R1_Chr3-1g05309 [Microbotryum saponariae]